MNTPKLTLIGYGPAAKFVYGTAIDSNGKTIVSRKQAYNVTICNCSYCHDLRTRK